MGQVERTGTNYLHSLLLDHQDVVKSSHPGEDRLAMGLEHLDMFIYKTVNFWSNSWVGMNKEKQQNVLLNSFRQCLSNYLKPTYSNDKIVLTKSPSTLGIQYFDVFFPNFKLIVLIRDGRNVVESLAQSFNKDYLDSMKEWTKSANRIIEYKRKKLEGSFLLVRYEDLNDNTEGEIRRILHFLNLSPKKMNWGNAMNKPVIGSSQSSDTKGEVDWSKNIIKTEKFKPNERYKAWTWIMRQKYNWICGCAAKDLGYEKFN